MTMTQQPSDNLMDDDMIANREKKPRLSVDERRESARKRSAKYRRKNPDKIRKQQAEYRRKNADKMRKMNVEWRRKNPDKVRKRKAEWRRKNADKARKKDAEYRRKRADKNRVYRAEYYQKNRDKVLKKTAEYVRKNADKVHKRQAKWRRKNADELRKRKAEYSSKIEVKIVNRQRSRLKTIVESTSVRRHEMTGCTPLQLRQHIESQFVKGMTWENQGRWHIDHIMPCSAFDLTKPDQVKVCFNWQNLRPIWAKKNLSKGKKITHPQLPLPIGIAQQT